MALDAAAHADWLRRQEPAQAWLGRGYGLIAGVDEVGRGPLAGPVVAAAVILSPEAYLPGLRDSKQLTALARQRYYVAIREQALGIGLGLCSVAEIDRLNIRQATFLAMRRALSALPLAPEVVLVDGEAVPELPFVQENKIGGDDLSNVIAAASVVAKVVRDRFMVALAGRFPGYELHQNKGYGTAEHRRAIRDLGPCPIHRRSFRLD